MLSINNREVTIIAVIIATLLSLFYKIQYNFIIGNEAHRFLIIVYGGFVSSDGLNFLQALAFCMPFLVQLLLFADTINKELYMATNYIFPRKDTRTKWILSKLKDIYIHSVYFYFLQFITVLVVSLFFGLHFDLFNVILVLVFLLITLASINTLIVMTAAILSVENKTSMIFSFFFTVYFAWIFLLPFIEKVPMLFQYMPFSHALLLSHNLPVHMFSIRGDIFHKNYIPIWCTILYGVTGIGLLSIISSLWLKKVNLVEGSI